MTEAKFANFSKGIVSPSLWARQDTLGYQTGLRKLRNCTIMRSGGLKNRAGTLYVAPTKNPGEAVRFVDFVFSASAGQSYVLVFGELYMWVVQAGVLLTDSDKTITGVTRAVQGVVTATSHGFTNGRVVYLSGIAGMTQLNGRYFKVSDATTHTFKIKTMAGDYVSTTGYGAWTSGGTASRVFELTTTYLAEDLVDLQWVQNADVMRLTCAGYAPRRLTRTGHTSWAIQEETFVPEVEEPVNGTGTAGAVGDKTLRYRVTAYNTSGEESNHGLDEGKGISDITLSNPIVVEAIEHDYEDGDEILLSDILGTDEVNDRLFIVANSTDDTFELEGEDGTGYTAYVSSGTARRTHFTIPLSEEPTDAAPNTLEWERSSSDDIKGYRVYREYGGVYGQIGESRGTSFLDKGFAPDTAFTPPVSFLGQAEPFAESTDFPSVCGHFQERLMLANTPAKPNGIRGSQKGFFRNFGQHFPIEDDDAINFAIPGTQVNEIRHLVDLRNLVILTSNGEYVGTGADGGPLTPASKKITQQSANGSSKLRPVLANGSLLYVQARGKSILDLFPDELAVEGYKGGDLTIFCDKLFRGREIVDWAYQQIPDSVVWSILDDGSIAGLTYIREQQIIGFHQHDTLGEFKNVCVIPEGSEDVPYFAVEREINGETVTYIERMASRTEDEDHPERNVFVDCGGTYNGWNTSDSHTMTASGSGWTEADFITMTSSTAFFTAADVGNMIFLKSVTEEEDGSETEEFVRFLVTAYTNATVVTVQPDRPVPETMQDAAITDWARAVDQVSAPHLVGQNVSIQADAFVEANPNNPGYSAVVTVDEDGVVSLPEGSTPKAVIHVGLPYVSDVETLDLDTAQGETLMTKKKLVTSVAVFVESSRGIWAGEEEPATDALLTNLSEFRPRQSTQSYDDPPERLTGVKEVAIKARWNEGGRVFLRQTDPVQMSILAIVPQGTAGGR